MRFGRMLRTARGMPVVLPGPTLARHIGLVWEKAVPSDPSIPFDPSTPFDPSAAPSGPSTPFDPSIDVSGRVFLRLAVMVSEMVGQEERTRAVLVDQIDHDLLLYRATWPDILVRKQQQEWQKWTQWLEKAAGIVLPVTKNLSPPSIKNKQGLIDILAAYDRMELSVLQEMAATSGSLILSLAFIHGRMNIAQFTTAALLGERYQLQRWGHDDEGEARLRAIEEEWQTVARFLDMYRMDAASSIGADEVRKKGAGYPRGRSDNA